ncbi:MAG: hypothetical protein ACOC9S_03665 [Planctomycetota bacterium]
MFLKWLPWRPIARRIARAHGLLDPVSVLARLERIAQPSEVSTPMELLRAGVVFHSRGLINTKVIQHNLDWVWPYWVRRQFDPSDEAFVPRAFSATHVNLTHRNWTAVGLPGHGELPLVDPRGLLTPLFDGWSIDAWILTDDGRELLPPNTDNAEQRLITEGASPQVRTETAEGKLRLVTTSCVENLNDQPVCVLRCQASADAPGWLVVALRPFNPEGVSFVSKVSLTDRRRRWRINSMPRIQFDCPVDRHVTSSYRSGDVYPDTAHREQSDQCTCAVGLATAAGMYRLDDDHSADAELHIDLTPERKTPKSRTVVRPGRWSDELDGLCEVDVPDSRFVRLYEAAVRTLSLLTTDAETVPGPYTYNRFWFRDAAMMLHAMLCIGHTDRARRVLDAFPDRQRVDGYFYSQDGEWDSNGEALWILHRYCELTGSVPPEQWTRPVVSGARWIHRKRRGEKRDGLHAGLMPAGFSAEHLGNNDYYYWDDFWSAAGLRAAAAMCRLWRKPEKVREFDAEAEDMLAAVERSLRDSRHIRRRPGIPASPYRRMDAGAIGSVVAGYPLSLLPERDERLLATVEFLMNHCFVKGAFFQDLIHSGLNAYLTLHLAQVLLRAGDGRFFALVERVAELASPTGQWPEAIHPRTGGGCMGDGQHGWASAEWVMMLRNMFVREADGGLVLCSGIPVEWLKTGKTMRLGPTATPYGPVSVTLEPRGGTYRLGWRGEWRTPPEWLEVRLSGCEPQRLEPAESGQVELKPAGK